MPLKYQILILAIVAVVLGVLATLIAGSYVAEVGYGYKDYGLPFPWKRIYGGVTAFDNYLYFGLDAFIFSLFFFILLTVIVLILGRRK